MVLVSDCFDAIRKIMFIFLIFSMTEIVFCSGFCLIGNPTWKGKPTVTLFNKNENSTNFSTPEHINGKNCKENLREE